MLFSSLLFIFQSKEYPRNVPENPARKFVEKEVCIKWTKKPKQTKRGRDQNLAKGEGITQVKEADCWCCVLLGTCLVLVERCLKRGPCTADEKISFVKPGLGCT